MTVSRLDIDTFRLDDVTPLVDAYQWLFAPPGTPPQHWDPHAAETRLRRLAATPDDGTIWVAKRHRDIVGFCSVYLDIESVRYGQRAWVEDLAIHPEHRSTGIGRQLLEHAKTWARQHDATHLELDSAMTRTDAHRFYDREQPDSRSICFGWIL